MGYKKKSVTFKEPRLSLYDSVAVSVYTEYIRGENSYQYNNPTTFDSFIILDGNVELVIDGERVAFEKGDHIDIGAGTHHGPICSTDGALILVIHRRDK